MSFSNILSLGGQTTCYSNNEVVNCIGRNAEAQGGFKSGYSNITHLVLGLKHTCLVDSGKVYCWGDNEFSQAIYPNLENISKIKSGSNHTCAIEDGDVYCWGINTSEQINIPDDVFDAKDLILGDKYTCAIVSSKLICWGEDAQYFEGQFRKLDEYKKLSGGGHHICGLRLNGKVECFGSRDSKAISPPDDLDYATDLISGFNHSCIIDKNKKVTCWGDNEKKALDYPFSNKVVKQLFSSSSANHTCAKFSDGEFDCWGDNKAG